MTEPTTAADVYRRSLDLLLGKDMDGLIAHYRDYWNPLAIPGSLDDAKFFPAAR
ncbi:hypothetical protein [Streptosporangium sp. 'caverna']|uniref:hypothetical protein n=1 Tax=Streptosporangium sp. 'caverna' TaxID=2202249 RepID=UPI0013A6A9A6|nr:hypothetical protein [Streptosporangium sp. 'caverna']